MSEDNWVLQTIETKSDQLNAQDLLTGSVDVTVVDVKRGNDEQPITIVIDGGRQPYKPCKSMRRVLIAMWGEYPKKWIGRQMRLFCDPDVMFGGVKAGGIRISHMSDVERTVLPLTVSRGRTKAYTIEPLKIKTKQYDVGERVQKAIEAIDGCKDAEKLAAVRKRVEPLLADCDPAQQRDVEAALKRAERRAAGGDEDGLGEQEN